jgi:hypothetical protein
MKLTVIPGKLKSTITEIIAALLILLFMYVAINKFIDHRHFVYTLSRSPLLAEYRVWISWIIPFIEIIICLFLFIPEWRRTGLLLSALLMIVFTFYISYMLLFTPNLPCSCGGIIQQLSWKDHFVLNIFLILLAFAGFIFSKPQKLLLQ